LVGDLFSAKTETSTAEKSNGYIDRAGMTPTDDFVIAAQKHYLGGFGAAASRSNTPLVSGPRST
jgi:hypothetical protein